MLSLKKINRMICLGVIFCIPFMCFPFLRFAGGLSIVTNSLFMVTWGILVWIVWIIRIEKRNIHITRYVVYVFCWNVYMSIHTILASILRFKTAGELWGETTFTASLSSHVYNLLVVITIAYFCYAYQFISKEDVCRLLDTLCIIVLLIGYLQLAILFRIPLTKQVYDTLNIGEWLTSSDKLLRMGRICLTGSEPSAVGNILGVFLLPYLLARRKHGEKKYTKKIILLLPLVFFTFSSTAYIAIAINILLFVFLLIKDGGFKFKNRTILWSLVVTVFAILVVVFSVQKNGSSFFVQQIEYFLFEKPNSKENYSTMYRSSTMINDIEIFKQYPILGVGNGNQGFWYQQNIPDWVTDSSETKEALAGKKGVLNGGAFLPAYISAFGIIGIIAILFFLAYYYKTIRCQKIILGPFYEVAIIAGITFLVLATQATSIEGNFYFYFILSIPLFTRMRKEISL